MKLYKLIIFILIIFIKTGNVLSVKIFLMLIILNCLKILDISNEQLANQAIKKVAFNELKKKILLNEDIKKLSGS